MKRLACGSWAVGENWVPMRRAWCPEPAESQVGFATNSRDTLYLLLLDGCFLSVGRSVFSRRPLFLLTQTKVKTRKKEIHSRPSPPFISNQSCLYLKVLSVTEVTLLPIMSSLGTYSSNWINEMLYPHFYMNKNHTCQMPPRTQSVPSLSNIIAQSLDGLVCLQLSGGCKSYLSFIA